MHLHLFLYYKFPVHELSVSYARSESKVVIIFLSIGSYILRKECMPVPLC